MTKSFPKEEKYGLTSQMRRSSYSVPTNIAEGNGRRSQAERRHFIEIAMGSLEELHYQSLLAKALGYINDVQRERTDDHIQRVGYLLHKLHLSLL